MRGNNERINRDEDIGRGRRGVTDDGKRTVAGSEEGD
jgi:hypothetical protein